jgi:hypothetical protein
MAIRLHHNTLVSAKRLSCTPDNQRGIIAT